MGLKGKNQSLEGISWKTFLKVLIEVTGKFLQWSVFPLKATNLLKKIHTLQVLCSKFCKFLRELPYDNRKRLLLYKGGVSNKQLLTCILYSSCCDSFRNSQEIILDGVCLE